MRRATPMRVPLVLLSGLALGIAALRADTTVLLDGFSFASTPGATNTDVNAEITTRQTGATPTTYTEVTNGNAANDALLEDSTVVGSDVALLRTIHGTLSSQTALRADTNFGSECTSKKWVVSYLGRLDRNDANVSDAWLGFSVGDQSGLTGPTGAMTDFGFLVRGNSGWQAWANGSVPANGTGSAGALRSPDLWGVSFTVTITVDETLAQPTAQVSVQVGSTSFNLGTWNVGFDSPTDRFIEVRALNGGNGAAAGALLDGRLDALTLTQINNNPQPPTITQPPQSQLLWVGDRLTLSVAATGTGPITYQWRLNNADIPGAAGATYTVANALAWDGGNYTIAVTNPAGTTTASAPVNVVFPTAAQMTWEAAYSNRRRAGDFGDPLPSGNARRWPQPRVP